MFDETGDEEKSQGWTALIIDTNGNGKRDAYVEPNQPVDPAKDKRFGGGFYAVAPAPDGSIWGTVLGFPGAVVRLDPGTNPPETALAEVYEPPFNDPKPGRDSRRAAATSIATASYWAALASGHLASFDRRKCKGPLNGPKATGQHCPEGWTLYAEPLPQFKGVDRRRAAPRRATTRGSISSTRSGLGANTPINTGNQSEGLLALKDGKWVVMRVPYPLGFYTKWMDGRIDDPKAGWKGKGLWATVSTPRRRSTWRRGRARRARSASSRSGPIRWRSRTSRVRELGSSGLGRLRIPGPSPEPRVPSPDSVVP